VDHFLCHYSSQRFAPVVRDLLVKAGLAIPDELWYSNLKTRGNTGAASIFVMLDDFLRERTVHPGEQVMCFVPESGRFSVGYLLMEIAGEARAAAAPVAVESPPLPEPPHDPSAATDPLMQRLLRELALVWHDYRSRAWRAPIIARIVRGAITHREFVRWMEDWIPQVQQGSIWMRKAVESLDERYARLRELVTAHASDEQYDFKILFDDYRRAGGPVARIEELRRNPGGEALNAYLHARAERPNPVGLLGSIYIIEGTGQRIVPALLPALRRQLALPLEAVRFLHYHGENDVNHLARWLNCADLALEAGGAAAADDIVDTARRTAQLYLMQLESIT
jgi:3-oxoacyl-[acyl-carrier-protein] synthase-3